MNSARHISEATSDELRALTAKINAILPPQYVGCFEDVPPMSMGASELRYGLDGKVDWGHIWTTFCHLALAGGPPHRGRLLEPVSAAEVKSQPHEQSLVVAEIERAIRLTTDLSPLEEHPAGWVAVRCADEDMAAWMVRAIVAENVMARHEGRVLQFLAGPHFRVEKEIKNVIVSLAKTCHYLLDHVEPKDRPRGFDPDLMGPALPDEIAASPAKYQSVAEEIDRGIRQQTPLETVPGGSPGWIGIRCVSEEMAVWMLRVVVENILVRRESNLLFLPVSLDRDSKLTQERLLKTLAPTHRLCTTIGLYAVLRCSK